MTNINVAEQINEILENIWMLLEKEERAMTNFPISNQQQVLLTLIIRHPHSSPTELANRLNITKSAVSQQLTKLEGEGLITKVQQAEDKRSFLINLGEKGLIYKKEVDSFYQKILTRYHSKLSPEELSNMLLSFEKFQEILLTTTT